MLEPEEEAARAWLTEDEDEEDEIVERTGEYDPAEDVLCERELNAREVLHTVILT